MSWRTNTNNLRLLLLGAIGGAVWACADERRECVAGDATCSDGSGGAGGEVGRCTDPKPLQPGVDTGYFVCAEGYLHRQVALACPIAVPSTDPVDWSEYVVEGDGGTGGEGGAGGYIILEDECQSDADCAANGQCRIRQTNFVYGDRCARDTPEQPAVREYVRECVEGCVEDSDCGDYRVCVCDSGQTWCAPVSGCRQDSDCEDGYLCLSNGNSDVWSYDPVVFSCQLPGDECGSDEDCGGGLHVACILSASGRTCEQRPVCGRPFLIEEEARKAAPISSPAWLTPSAKIRLADLQLPTDATVRDQLAAHWTEIGLLEHASVAAFARFTLQLLSLGAPVELVEQSQRAALDEVRHAELTFALASRYAGRSMGPGPLPLTGALDASSVEAILRTTVREGCIGETRAALEASRAAETCEDPAVRSVLETIAADEARHAELAWRVVRFIVSAHPEMASVLAEEFGSLARQERTLTEVDGPVTDNRFGVLDARALRRCHREAHRDVIAPCARALLAILA